MARARLGDDTYREDPTVRRFEESAAELFGMQAALLVLSGTMANLVSVMTHCPPGSLLFADQDSHLIQNEAGGLARISGVMYTCVEAVRGHMRPESLAARMRHPQSVQRAIPRLVWLENTHNAGGGSVLPLRIQSEIQATAQRTGLPVHVDGARILNAAAAQALPVQSLTQGLDSLTIDLTKGLSCPLGAAVLGSHDFIAAARRNRQVLGGGMRQAGVIAACGIVGFEDLWHRAEQDNSLASMLATKLAELPALGIDPSGVDTNMIYVDVSSLGPSTAFVAALAGEGLLVSDRPPNQIRLVTHRHVSKRTVMEAFDIIRLVVERWPRRARGL